MKYDFFDWLFTVYKPLNNDEIDFKYNLISNLEKNKIEFSDNIAVFNFLDKEYNKNEQYTKLKNYYIEYENM